MATVVVVGGGLAGLAAAARLARQRHEVTLLDAGTPGELAGSADELASFTLPAVYRDLFRKTGRPLEPDLQLVSVDPARRYLFPDGRVLDLPTGSRGAMLDAFGRCLGVAAAHEWDAFITWGGALWDRLRPHLVPAGEAPGSGAPVPQRARLREPANRLILEWYGIDAGADAAAAPADLAVLPYLEQAFGSWQVDGRLPALAAATAQRARRCGATLRGGAEVVRVSVRDGKVTGAVAADGTTVPAEVVVDAVGLPPAPGTTQLVQRPGPATVAVRVLMSDPLDLPVETVLLPRGNQGGIVVVRPDVAADPCTVLLRGTVPTAPAAGAEADLARQLLAALGRAGVSITGEVTGVSVRQRRGSPARERQWRRRSMPGWLDLRAGLVDPDVDGLLRAAPQVTGGLAVPWQGLAAALVAAECGTVPRHSAG